MPFIIFHTRSHERSQLPLRGWVLSGRSFTMCITMEVETAKQYKHYYCCICKNYRRKVEKQSLQHFLANQKTVSVRKKMHLLASYGTVWATSFCLLPDTLWPQTFKNAFKLGTVNFASSLSPPSIVKKVHTGSKNSQGTSVMPGKNLRELTAPPKLHNNTQANEYTNS